MGYCTAYNITYDGSKTTSETDSAIEKFFMKVDGGGWEVYAGEICGENRMWYDQEIDMYCLSKKFPDILFTVSGHGDDWDDSWEEHWQDGSMQHCHMEIPPYDPNQMVKMELDAEGRLIRASSGEISQEESTGAVDLGEVI